MADDVPERRRVWRLNWLCCLLALADIDLQRERWLNREITNPHWSYVEFMCEYFDDCRTKDYASLLEEGFVSQVEFDCVRDFHEALDIYRPTNQYDHDAILDDPNWRSIVARGRDSLKFLRTLIADPTEQQIFLSKPLHARLALAISVGRSARHSPASRPFTTRDKSEAPSAQFDPGWSTNAEAIAYTRFPQPVFRRVSVGQRRSFRSSSGLRVGA